ncbi:MAG: thioredoxin family protein [Terrimicrobiaceae bacterium]
MKIRLLLPVFALILSAAGLLADRPGWSDDYEKSLARAKEEKKLTLLDFTGSDWCGWCIKLDNEVFSKSKFKSYAKDNLVLVELDFPRGKSQTKKLKEQNARLAAQYNIEGYPTVIVLNSDGKKVGELGYLEGGPEAFIAELEKLKGK